MHDITMTDLITEALNRKCAGQGFHTDEMSAALDAEANKCGGNNGLTKRMREELVDGLQHGVMFSNLPKRIKSLVLRLRGLGWQETAVILLRMWGVIFNVRPTQTTHACVHVYMCV